MSAKYTLHIASISKLIKAIADKTESRRRITIQDETGLIANARGTKKQGPFIAFTYGYKDRHTKTMKYIPLGKYEPTRQCIEEIRIKCREAHKTKTTPDEPLRLNKTILTKTNRGQSPSIQRAYDEWKVTEFIHYRKNTIVYFERFMKHLMNHFQTIRTSDVTTPHIIKALTDIKERATFNAIERQENKVTDYTGNSSTNSALAVYKIFFDWCAQRGWVYDNPTKHIKRLPTNDNTKVEIEKDELVAYLKQCTSGLDDNNRTFDPTEDDGTKQCPQQKRYFKLLLYTGMRPGELRELRIKDIKEVDSYAIITINKERAKSGKTVKIPISTTAMNTIDAQLKYTGYNNPNDLVFPSETQKYWHMSPQNKGLPNNTRNKLIKDSAVAPIHQKHCIRAGVDYFRPHGLRHIFITTMDELGIDGAIQRRLTSHSDGSSDTHGKTYNHHINMKKMTEAVSRVAIYLNHLTNPSSEDLVPEDLQKSFLFWISKDGQELMVKHDMEFGQWFATNFTSLLVNIEKSGLSKDIESLQTQFSDQQIALVMALAST